MRSLKVLILEDNPFQLMVLHQMLNAWGVFDVLTAESVESARRILSKRGAIDVVICELYGEGASVQQLIRELALKHEVDAMILLSGAPSRASEAATCMARGQGVKVLGCLPRPVSMHGLGHLLQVYKAQASTHPGTVITH